MARSVFKQTLRVACYLATVLFVASCAARFGELHSAPALVVIDSKQSPLTYWLIAPEEDAALPRTTVLKVGAHPPLEELLAAKTVYQTNPNRHRMIPQRVVAVIRCQDGYRRLPLDLRGTMQVNLDCGTGS